MKNYLCIRNKRNDYEEENNERGYEEVNHIEDCKGKMLDVMDLDISIDTDLGKMTLEEYNRNCLKGFYSRLSNLMYPLFAKVELLGILAVKIPHRWDRMFREKVVTLPQLKR